MEKTMEEHILNFIAFLEEARTYDAIVSNPDFQAIALHFHTSVEDQQKAAMHFNWISVRALPAPAVRSWVSERCRHRKYV